MRIGEATNERDLISALREAYQRRLQMRLGFESQWWNNIAMLSGDHFSKWDPTTGKLVEESKNAGEVRLALNHTLTVARTELAKLTKSRPIMEVVANSEESSDLAAARIGKKALEGAEWKFKLRQFRKQAYWWMIACGMGAVFVGYDHLDEASGMQRYVIDPTTGEPTFNPIRQGELREMLEKGEIDRVDVEEYPLGELEYKVYSPFQLLPDETKLSFQEIQDLITDDVVDLDVLRGLYGASKTRDLMPERNALGTIERRAIARAGLANLQKSPEVEGTTNVHTWWLLPNKYRHNKFLKGGMMVRWVNNDRLLEIERPFPFDDLRMPFIFFEHIPAVTSIWPESMIQHITAPNVEMNKKVSQLIEAANFMGNPMWRVATQHQIPGKTIKSKPGNIIRYTHAPNIPEPEPIHGMQMPTQVENLVVALREQILEISGQGETSRGRVPPGVRSGVAVAYLQEEDETKLGPTTENIEEGNAYMASLTLSRMSQFYNTQRILRYHNRADGYFDALKFKGADLKGTTDVMPVAGSALPKMKAARQQHVLDMVSLGVEKDPKRVRDLLEIGAGEPDDIDKARMQASRENNLMLRGIQLGMMKLPAAPTGEEDQAAIQAYSQAFSEAVSVAVPVKSWHNHAAHLQQHYGVMMDEEFDRLASDYPHIVRLFDEHTAMHEQELARQRMEQMQMMMAMRGAPEPGSPSQNGTVPPAEAGTMSEADARSRATR